MSITRVNDFTVIVGGVCRIQCLSETLARIEQARADGSFCDEPTFMVASRDFEGIAPEIEEHADAVTIKTPRYWIEIKNQAAESAEPAKPAEPSESAEFPESAELSAIIRSLIIKDPASGEPLWRAAQDWPGQFDVPSPVNPGRVWAVADAPRALPPPWGAAPGPEEELGRLPPELAAQNGWRLELGARDLIIGAG